LGRTCKPLDHIGSYWYIGEVTSWNILERLRFPEQSEHKKEFVWSAKANQQCVQDWTANVVNSLIEESLGIKAEKQWRCPKKKKPHATIACLCPNANL